MRLALKNVAANLLSWTGLLAVLENQFQKGRSFVFALHRVVPREELSDCYNPHLAFDPAAFDQFLDFLRRHSSVIPLEELPQRMAGSTSEGFSVITFDDGWEDNYRLAFPLLKKHGVPATIFLPTAFISSNRLLPEERFVLLWQSAARNGRASDINQRLSALTASGAAPPVPDREHWHASLKKVPLDRKLQILDDLEHAFGKPQITKPRFMTWEQVAEMSKAGVSFGSHTVNHRLLAAENDQEVRAELQGSRRELEQRLGVPIKTLAYPSGSWSPRAKELVREAGYAIAVTTEVAAVSPGFDELTIPRLPIDSTVVSDTEYRFKANRLRLQMIRAAMA